MTHGFARTLPVQPQPIGRLPGRNCSNVTDILVWKRPLTSASPLPQPWWAGRLRDPRLAATLLDSSLQLEFIKPLSARYDGHHEMVDFGLSSTDRQAPPGKGRADDQPQNADFEH
jgi:hypothetical protein